MSEPDHAVDRDESTPANPPILTSLPANEGRGGVDLRPYLALGEQIMARRRAEMSNDTVERLDARANENVADVRDTAAALSAITHDEARRTLNVSASTGNGEAIEIKLAIGFREVDNELFKAVSGIHDYADRRTLEHAKDIVDQKFWIYNQTRKAIYNRYE